MLDSFVAQDIQDTCGAPALAKKLLEAVNLLKCLMDQTERRVFRGEKVPATKKIVSFFETHTELLSKATGIRNTDIKYF